MKIHGLQKMTLLDFPGRVACTVFLGGCDFRCPFCHNFELIDGTAQPIMDEDELLAFLRATKEGPAPGTLARDIPGMDTPERLRMLIYTALSLTGAIPVNLDGTLPLTQLADHLFATLTGTDGGPGLTIAEAGDTALRDLLDLLFAERVESALRFGPAFRDQAAAHLETLKRRADVLRRLAFAVLFPDGWDTAEDLGTAATFFGNTAIIAPAHYNENYVALARTMLAWGIGEH